MPGLLGEFYKNKSNDSLINLMLKTLKHENWYKINKYKNEFCSLGRIHLNIFNHESQPIFNKNHSLCIFMDGKIYDYANKKNELINKGYKFKIKNDAEFCLFLYEENGLNFVKKLNGDFVIAIIDIKNKKLMLFNDRYGLRPLFYVETKNKLLFAPEVKALLCDKEIKKKFDYSAVIDFLSFGRMINNKTFYKNIKILPPASIFIFDGKILTIKKYWDFKYKPNYNTTEKEFINNLIKKFKKAVNIRIKENLNYGISLSGGLDSRTIMAAIDKKNIHKITAFSFGIKKCNEIKIAKILAKKSDIKFNFIEIKAKNILDNAKRATYLTDGMNYIGVSYILPTHKIIREKSQIILDGLALDLTLGGSSLNKNIKFLKNNSNFVDYYYKNIKIFSDKDLNKLLIRGFTNKENFYLKKSLKNIVEKININRPENKSDYFMIQEHVRRGTIMGHVLVRTLLETSNPTYDNELIDLILTIPPELRINHYIYRKFLKKLNPKLSSICYDKTMIRPDLPYLFWRISSKLYYYKTIIQRELIYCFKKDISLFPERSYVNFSKWLYLNDNWKKYFTELLLNKNSLLQKYLNQSFIKKLLENHGAKSGFLKRIDNSKKILYLATFEHLLRSLKE